MIGLSFGDLHAHGNWPFSKITPDGLTDRFHHLLAVLAQAERVIQEQGVTDLFILGDLLHRRHFIQFKTYNVLIETVARLAAQVSSVCICVGNHDLESDGVHALTPYQYIPNVVLFDQPGLYRASDGTDISIIPYLADHAAVVKAFDAAPGGAPVMSHYAAEGCPLETDYWLESPVKLGELSRFPWTIFSHVHKPSDQMNGRVVYQGAPLHFDFGDHGSRGGMLIKGHELSRVLFSAPQFVTAKYPRIPLVPVTGGYLRILDVPGAEQVDVREKALAMGWTDATTLEAALPPEVKAAVTSGLILGEAMLREHVARRAPDLDAVQQQMLVDEGLKLLEEARR